MSQSALSDSFEYLCYGSTAIRNILILFFIAGSVFIRQNLTYKDVSISTGNIIKCIFNIVMKFSSDSKVEITCIVPDNYFKVNSKLDNLVDGMLSQSVIYDGVIYIQLSIYHVY